MTWWNTASNKTTSGGTSSLKNAGTGSGGSAPASGGGTDWWSIGANVLGSVLPAVINNSSANKQADALNASSQQNAQLQRDIYNDQRGLAMPGYIQGGAARNILANQFGIAPMDYAKAAQGGYGYGGNVSSDGSPLLPNYGAGQPVAGHSSLDYTGNVLAGGLGSAAGFMLGGPVGSIIGGLAGGLIRPSGDNWTTLATQAPGGYDYEAYWNDHPDLAAGANGWNKPDVQKLFNGNKDAYLYWHYNTFGKDEGRKLKELAPSADDKSNQPVGGAQQVTSTGTTNPLGDPLEMFWDSPHGRLATDQFLSIDNPSVKGAFSAGGQVMSGAEKKALQDRGRATAGGFFSGYNADLKDMAGMNNSSTALMANAGQNYGSTMGNILNQQGQVAANKSQQLNNNWMNAGGNILAGGYDFVKGQGWI